MGNVLMEISMSLDGYVAGPDVSPEAPMGRGGEHLHEWMFTGRSASESEQFESEHFSTVGALILGRRMADLGIGPWGEEPTFHAPCFVVTHRPAPTIVKKGGTSYHFVTGGIEAALAEAQAAAGSHDVLINGGADIARQFLNAGLIDEIRLHLVPVVLGAGTPLFTGVSSDVRPVPKRRNQWRTGHASHLRGQAPGGQCVAGGGRLVGSPERRSRRMLGLAGVSRWRRFSLAWM